MANLNEAEERETAATAEETRATAEAAKGSERTLTQAEVDALIDRRMARERRDAEKRLEEAREEARREGEERARMTEAERTKSDREKAEKATREREARLQEREREITRRELRAEAIDKLIEKDLPRELAELLDYTSEEARDRSLETVEKVVRASIQAGIDQRIARGGGRVGASGGHGPDTDRMTDAEYYAYINGRKG